MPVYKASQIRYMGDQALLGDLLAKIYLTQHGPKVLDLRVICVGSTTVIGKDADEYRIEITFESELDKREAFKLAEHQFGTITEGFIKLEDRAGGRSLEDAARELGFDPDEFVDEAIERRDAEAISKLAKERLVEPTPVEDLLSLEELEQQANERRTAEPPRDSTQR